MLNNCYSIIFQLEVAVSFVIPFTIWLLAILKRSILLLCLRFQDLCRFQRRKIAIVGARESCSPRACVLHWPPTTLYICIYPFARSDGHSWIIPFFLKKTGEKGWIEEFHRVSKPALASFRKSTFSKTASHLVFCCWLCLVYRKRVFYIGLEKKAV